MLDAHQEAHDALMRLTRGFMSELRNAEVYRVCAVSGNRWDVYQEPRPMPVASFNDKAAALNYAMCLARGRVAWHLLLRSGEPAASEADAVSARH